MATDHKQYPLATTANEFIGELMDVTKSAQQDESLSFNTMQIASQPEIGSKIVDELVDAFVTAAQRGVNVKVAVDSDYVNRLTRIGNRDFPNPIPLFNKHDRQVKKVNRVATNTALAKLAISGTLIESGVAPANRGYTPRLRQLGSLHILQRLAVKHIKESHFIRPNKQTIAWITSANLTDSDLTNPDQSTGLGMNNITLRVHGRLALFIANAVTSDFGHISGTHRYTEAGVTVVHDVNNSGEPAKLSGILTEALIAVDPRRSDTISNPDSDKPKEPSRIVLLSQYLPDGLFLSALQQSAQHADVYIAAQPATDHRTKNFPYNVHNFVHDRQIARSGIVTYKRDIPSHTKLLLVRYNDGTAKIIAGTDNFTTHLQKFVRNEDLALMIDLDLKKTSDAKYFSEFAALLQRMGEITPDIQTALM